MVAIVHTAPPSSFVAAEPRAFAEWLDHVAAAYSMDERAAIGNAVEVARSARRRPSPD